MEWRILWFGVAMKLFFYLAHMLSVVFKMAFGKRFWPYIESWHVEWDW